GLAIGSDARILVAGSDDLAGHSDFALARYDAAGLLDTTFGSGGLATADFGQSGAQANGVAVEPDGRIVVVGTANSPVTGRDFALARFLAAGPQIGSFTASPNPTSAGSDLTLTASNITDANPGATITQVAFYVDSNRDGILEAGTDTLLGDA